MQLDFSFFGWDTVCKWEDILKGSLSTLGIEKNCIDWFKMRCLQKTTMGWKSGNEGENRSRWLSKDVMCAGGAISSRGEVGTPHQGRTTPGPRSRSAGRRQALPVPTRPALQRHPLLALLLHLGSSSLCSFAHSHRGFSSQGHLHKVCPFCKTEFRWQSPPQRLSFGSKTLWF